MSKTVLTVDSFFRDAKKLRAIFTDRFQDPHNAHAGRFVWDYWHVPEQYTALRTPAYHFFPGKLYDEFHNQLVWWGRRNLGCHDVSPPWMSCYVDGCKQELHGDLPHGPWAFVFSLTPWRGRKFQGGETLLLRDEILSYWQSNGGVNGLEREQVFREVPPLFNRLTVFDPRIPHGVKEVRGVHDVLQARLVVHGWFVQPRPFIEGVLKTRELQGVIDDLGGGLKALFDEGLEIQGTTSMRFRVRPSGAVDQLNVLTNSLRHPRGDKRIERALVAHISRFLLGVQFSRQKAPSHVTLPLVFQ
jgi:hypothetical protein